MYLRGIRLSTRLFLGQVLVMLALFGARNALHGQCVHFFDDEDQFLLATVSPSLESFEGLTATNSFTTDQLVLSGFTMDFSGPFNPPAGVWNVPFTGGDATHGSNWVGYQSDDNESVTFTFSSPKNAFGINIIDWGDFGSGSLTFMNSAGDSYTVAVAPHPNGNQRFFGVVNYEFSFDMVVFTQSIPGEFYALDEVYCEFINFPRNNGLACKNVNVSLNERCTALVVPEMVLSGWYPCYDDYVVELSYHNQPISNPVGLDHLGKHITATVIDTTTGNSCWSTIYVEDKFAPEVLCVDDTVNCIVYNMYYDTPRVVEYCLDYEIRKIDEYVESLSCDSNYIKRVEQTFIAIDEYGNVSDTCSREILIERFPLDNVQCPKNELTLYCDDNFRVDGNGYPHPDITGAPYLYNQDLSRGELYGADNRGNYFKVDLSTGQAYVVSDEFNNPPALPCPALGLPGEGVTEIEIDPISGMAYGKSVDGCDYGFLFDPKSGCINQIYRTVPPPRNFFGDFQGAEVVDGTWYVSSVTRGALDIFDPILGTFTRVGPHGGGISFNGLAWDGSTLYGCLSRGGTALYSIDINTGSATLIGDMGVSLGSIEFGPDGYLYGGGGRPPFNGNIYRINPANAATNLVGATGLGTTVTSLVLVPEQMPLYPQPDFFCNLWVDYRDTDLGKVGCTRKIMRTWEIQEWWCTEDLERRCTQFFYITDTTGPELELHVDSIYATTNIGYHNCDGDVYIPDPTVFDACHEIDRIDVRYPGGFISDWQGEKIKLEVGFHTVYVIAYDSCYNMSEDSFVVHMQDKIAPIAVCDQNTVISLDNDGVVHAYAEVFDDGSFDDCVIKKMEVRRMDDPCLSGTDEWGDYVEFCCADVNQEVMVAFRVQDKSGNYGTCMVNVLVNDKLPPHVVCPPDITVDCRFDWDPNHLDVFGNIVAHDSLRQPIVIDSDTVRFDGPALDGVAYDNCPMVMLDSIEFESIDNCGNGILYRYFMSVDAQGQRSLYCTQRITFVNSNPFNANDIIWPADFDTSNVCASFFFDPDLLSEERARPRYNNNDECSLVGATYEDHVIDNTGGAEGCFKILRKWKVIDWCQFERNQFMKWEHEQVILVENTNDPTMITRFCQDTVFCFYTPNCVPPPFTLSVAAIDDCTFRDDLYWTSKFDYDNDGSFDTIRYDGNSITDVFPVGEHRVKWIVEDLCGNEAECEYIFEIRNCKAPLAYCRTGAILELIPMDLDGDGTPDTEMVELWASDLDDGSTSECQNGVTFSFSEDTTDNVRWYDCDSIGNRPVTIFITDRVTGNQSRCHTMVTIQDNNNVNVCQNVFNGNIAGLVKTTSGMSLNGANVHLEGSGLPDVRTDLDGEYAFGNMPYGGQYELSSYKNDDVLNGVTTADIVQLQRYLLGKADLSNPYQHIAGDVNLSGDLSAADISEIRKLILGKTVGFTSDLSWRFLASDYQFVDPKDPLKENFDHSVIFDPFDQDEVVDWTGVKLGDLDESADPTGLNGNINTRTAFNLQAENSRLIKDEVSDIVITNKDLKNIDALQFTLEVNSDMAQVLEVIPLDDRIDYGNFNLSIKHLGLVTFSWDNPHAEEIQDLFLIRLQAKSNALTGDVIRLTSEVTVSAMSSNGEERPVQLAFVERGDLSLAAELYQNIPNPWRGSTVIRFQMPESQNGELSILDANGRTVWSVDGVFEKGMNVFEVDQGQLRGAGIYYYQLKTDSFVQTRKMLLL